MSKRARFGRVRIRLDELKEAGVIDFAKLLDASAPADEPEGARRATAFLSAGIGVSVQDQQPAAQRSDSIPGEDMSDEDDNRGVGKKARGGRGIFESIIAKWSSLSAPDAGKDSDEEGGGSGEEYDDAQDSGDPHYCAALCSWNFAHVFPSRTRTFVWQMITSMMMV